MLNPHPSILGGLAALGVAAAPLVFATACGAAYSTEPGAPSLVMPAHFGEGKGEPAASTTRAASAASAAPASAPVSPSGSASAVPAAPALTPSTAPDPTALRMAEQVEYDLELSEGKVRVVSVKAVKLPSPIVTARKLGRYAIELRIGPELIERVRFDFPGTAADEPELPGKKKLYAPLTLGARAIARVKLLVPQSPRVRQAVLVDRGLNTATALEWPLPEVAKAPASASPATSTIPPALAAPSAAAAPSLSAAPAPKPQP